jgi:DNA (cytosine-5)-methyltransferase 1
LFCGAGGFSEGFRQAGFDIVCAVDHAPKACETYSMNHPSTEVIQEDVMDLEAGDLPSDVDVLIGSPPCTEFSLANNGGSGDVDEGMRFVHRFLHFVDALEPRYWIMENVPPLKDHLPEEVDLGEVAVAEGGSRIELKKRILNAAEYATPQRRRRLFSGRFPEPKAYSRKRTDLGDVLDELPPPWEEPVEQGKVEDPVRPFKLDVDRLTDHFYDTTLTPREAEEIRRRKVDHSYYGLMRFPEELDAPARTIIRSNRRIAREAMVLPVPEDAPLDREYRQPTVRECASIQGFPLTYEFEGTSHASKWGLVGDAVPPPVSYGIAWGILEEEGMDRGHAWKGLPREPSVDLNEAGPDRRSSPKLGLGRPFRHHVPYDDMRAFRVDIETVKDDQPVHPGSRLVDASVHHPVRFRVVFYKGYAKDVESTPLSLEKSISLLQSWARSEPGKSTEPVASLIEETVRSLDDTVPDATTFQASRARRHGGRLAPDGELVDFWILEQVAEVVDAHLPDDAFGDSYVDAPELLGRTELPVRTLAKAVVAGYVAEKLNTCSRWLSEIWEAAYIPANLEEINAQEARKRLTCEGCVDTRFLDLADRLQGGKTVEA